MKKAVILLPFLMLDLFENPIISPIVHYHWQSR